MIETFWAVDEYERFIIIPGIATRTLLMIILHSILGEEKGRMIDSSKVKVKYEGMI